MDINTIHDTYVNKAYNFRYYDINGELKSASVSYYNMHNAVLTSTTNIINHIEAADTYDDIVEPIYKEAIAMPEKLEEMLSDYKRIPEMVANGLVPNDEKVFDEIYLRLLNKLVSFNLTFEAKWHYYKDVVYGTPPTIH